MEKRNPFVVFTDAMLCLFGSAMLMLIVLMIASHNTQTPTVKPPGEYIVTLEWNDKRDVDLDLWMLDPKKAMIYFANREDVNISLDRDSRGFVTNRQMLPDGRIIFSGNKEVITIRAIVPGDYVIAVGYYAGDLKPINFAVSVIQLNPGYKEIVGIKQHVEKVGDTKNIVAFHIDEDGKVTILPLPTYDIIKANSSLYRGN